MIFFEEKNDNYKIKVFAGQIGLVLDPTDDITNENTNLQINTNEVLVYFPTLSVWHIFDAFIKGYKIFKPFEDDQCYILNKSYLLPLFFENQIDTE